MALRSETISELVKALSKAQGSFNAITKGSKGYNYKYADLSSVLGGIQEGLAENGLCIVHTTIAQENKLITTLFHESGEWIATEIPLTYSASDKTNVNQARGAAITYSRRYNILCLLNLATDDDDGESSAPKARYNETNKWNNTSRSVESNKLSEQQSALLDGLLVEIKDPGFVSHITSHLGVKSLYDMNPKDFDKVLKTVEKKITAEKLSA